MAAGICLFFPAEAFEALAEPFEERPARPAPPRPAQQLQQLWSRRACANLGDTSQDGPLDLKGLIHRCLGPRTECYRIMRPNGPSAAHGAMGSR